MDETRFDGIFHRIRIILLILAPYVTVVVDHDVHATVLGEQDCQPWVHVHVPRLAPHTKHDLLFMTERLPVVPFPAHPDTR